LPTEDEDDAVLLAGLRERMDAIEAMRNCVAHNRQPSKRIKENYDTARPLLDNLLDEYLVRWELNLPEHIEEMFWDSEASEAVEAVLEGARWNEENGTITLFDPDEDRIRETVHSREELHEYLCNVARIAFYANAPREDGEYLYECDDNGIVEDVLSDYGERLNEIFGPE
jgi:hypothetical protein